MTCKHLFSLLFLISLMVLPASAQSISFSDIHLLSNQKIDVYEVNGTDTTYLGEFNTTDSLTLNPDLSYHVVLKPNKMDWYQSGTLMLTYLTTSDGGLVLNALMYFAVFGGGFIFLVSRLWNR